MKKKLQLAAAPLSLGALDSLAGVDLVAFVAQDERPLRGLAGFADWRLCGALTRQIKAGHFEGRPAEALLTVSAGRLPVERIFLFGLGRADRLDAAGAGRVVEDALSQVARAGGSAIATHLPQVGDAALNVRARALTEAARATGIDRIVLLHQDERAADRALAVAAETLPGVELPAGR